MTKSLYSKSLDDLTQELGLSKAYQAKQITAWLAKGARSWDEMSDLPQSLRQSMIERKVRVISSRIADRQDDRNASKLLIALSDGSLVECVMLSDRTGRKTACISSQVGCAMGCAFCKTGTMGLVRNLEDYEIVEQFVHLRTLDPTIGHIVFMGMGEPLNNPGALMRAITTFHRPDLFNISYRKMTVSTCGVVPGIRSLAELDLGVRLAVSLVSADDATRSRIMKIAWNPVDELDFRSPTTEEIRKFTSDLDHLRVPYTIRMSKGRGISGACGQLATSSRRVKA